MEEQNALKVCVEARHMKCQEQVIKDSYGMGGFGDQGDEGQEQDGQGTSKRVITSDYPRGKSYSYFAYKNTKDLG